MLSMNYSGSYLNIPRYSEDFQEMKSGTFECTRLKNTSTHIGKEQNQR